MSRLTKACISGDLDKVQEYLDTDDINEIDKKGFTPLYHACKQGRFEVVRVLLECASIDVNKISPGRGYTALHLMCSMMWVKKEIALKHREILDLLLNHRKIDIHVETKDNFEAALAGGSSDKTPIMLAVAAGNQYSTMKLLKKRANFSALPNSNSQSLLQMAWRNGGVNVSLKERVTSERTAPMHMACFIRLALESMKYGSKAQKQELLDLLIDDSLAEDVYTSCSPRASQEAFARELEIRIKKVQSTNATGDNFRFFVLLTMACPEIDLGPLFRAACKSGCINVVWQLLSPVYKVNCNLGNNEGETPLLLAASEGHALVVQALLQQGATYTDGLAAINVAIEYQHPACITVLLNTVPSLRHEADADGNTLLHIACKSRDYKTIYAVLHDCADTTKTNNAGKTAFQLADNRGWASPFAPSAYSTAPAKIALVSGNVLGVAIGVAVGAALALTVFTGGLAAPIVIGLLVAAAIIAATFLGTRAGEVKCLKKDPENDAPFEAAMRV